MLIASSYPRYRRASTVVISARQFSCA